MISFPLSLSVLAIALSGVLIIVILVVSWRDRRRAGRAVDNAGHGPAEAGVAQHAQRRAVIAVAFTIALFIAIASIGFAAPQLLGIPFGIAPGLAVSGGLLLFAASGPPRTRQPTITRASLDQRHPWSFGPRWAFGLPLGIAAAFIAFLVVTGITSTPDEDGLYRSVSAITATTSSTASPYPGWFYGLPLMAVTAVLAISTLLALRRVSVTPTLPNTSLAPLDRIWREVSTLVITKLSTAALLAYFGGTTFIAGQATHNVASSLSATGHVYLQPEFATGITLQVAGALLAISGLAFFVAATFTAATLRTRTKSVLHGDAITVQT